ncbi:hypothetical protein NQ314_001425 [Rhamnusium bicolor]|uniref:Acid phosphatase n=1 Tax=Rhamnusium bicolor TaxID=1586634 RepID=A0AAV8ZS56_9CUCU|nr:hypothetical protein NQ314_001425 [Rhamnusium bicolor]
MWHGERSPTETYPNDPHKNFNWSGGWGHLTNLRAYYNDFLPELYWHEEIKVISSYADRCLMSAELVAAGLFPPKGNQIWNYELLWQPIPIIYLPRSQDTLIAMKAECEKYDQMFKEVMDSQKVQNILSENKYLLKYLSENSKMEVNNLGTVETLFNTLEIEKLNNLTLSLWINDTVMETMKNLGAQNLALYSETEYMKRMKGGVLLKTVAVSMEKTLEGKKEPLLFLYSGHDLTIVHVLRSLNLTNTIKPSFGASLVFELYANSEVKIMYKNSWDGITQEKYMHFCTAPCEFNAWKKALQPVLPINWDEECRI